MDRPTPRAPWRPRRRFFVHRRLQGRFALFLLAVQAVALLTFQALLQLRLEGLRESLASPEAARALDAVADQNLLGLGLSALCTGALMVLLALWFSHRVVGPLPRLKDGLRRLAAGDYAARLHFRPEDYLGDLADDFNAAATALQRRHAEEQVRSGSGPVRPVAAARPVGAETWVG